MKTYRDLDVYKISFELACKCHELSLKLPSYETYEEASQVRRSSKAITANIVEGYGRKKYKAEFVKFLIYAHASCDETICHLQFIQAIHISSKDICDNFIERYNELGAKLNRFITYVEKEWETNKPGKLANPQPVTRNP
jgi:four helix bundle protein